MARPQWSVGAFAALRKLHRCKWLMFVEGPDDVAFWDMASTSVGAGDFVIKVAGNDSEVEQMFRFAETVDWLIVAGDRDYRPWVGTLHQHPRMVYTYGYSVENSLYAPSLLAGLLQDLTGVRHDEAVIEQQLLAFAQACRGLLVLDLADRMTGSGEGPLGNNCSRFLTSRGYASEEAIRRHCLLAGSQISGQAVVAADQLIEGSGKALPHLLRGHFLTHFVLRLVTREIERARGKGSRVQVDVLKGSLIGQARGRWPNREDFEAIRVGLRAAFGIAPEG